jgi:hypothetical protein
MLEDVQWVLVSITKRFSNSGEDVPIEIGMHNFHKIPAIIFIFDSFVHVFLYLNEYNWAPGA